MLRIGEFSKLTKTTIKALRYYDELGILKPAFVDGETLYRYYTEVQIEIAQRIQMYKSAGLSCKDIAKIFKGEANIDCLLSLRKKELEILKTDLVRKIENINRLVNNNETQAYTPCVKEIDSFDVYCSRSFISDISKIRDFILLTMNELKRTNPDVGFPSPDYCCVIYPGDSYREENIFVEYVQSVDKIGTDTDVIKFKKLEPITAVSVVHFGGYETLCDAYLSAVKYALENGYEICANARERYIDGAWNCKEKQEWKTEIQLPVKKIEGDEHSKI